MGITLLTWGDMFAPLQGLVAWFAPRASRPAPAAMGRAGIAHPAASCVRGAWPASPVRTCEKARRPLRVVRVVDGAAAPASAGRMFISGRMADVCAELDRLAALEAG